MLMLVVSTFANIMKKHPPNLRLGGWTSSALAVLVVSIPQSNVTISRNINLS